MFYTFNWCALPEGNPKRVETYRSCNILTAVLYRKILCILMLLSYIIINSYTDMNNTKPCSFSLTNMTYQCIKYLGLSHCCSYLQVQVHVLRLCHSLHHNMQYLHVPPSTWARSMRPCVNKKFCSKILVFSNLSNTFTLEELTLNKLWKILLRRNILNTIKIQCPYGRYFRDQITTAPHQRSTVNT